MRILRGPKHVFEVANKALLIGISGYGLDLDREAARQAGFDHYCVKPVDAESLAELLHV